MPLGHRKLAVQNLSSGNSDSFPLALQWHVWQSNGSRWSGAAHAEA